MILQSYLKTDWILADIMDLQPVFLDKMMYHDYAFYRLIFPRYIMKYNKIWLKSEIYFFIIETACLFQNKFKLAHTHRKDTNSIKTGGRNPSLL